MARILRGDILWANLDPVIGNEQAGKRPVLIISKDYFNEKSESVIALAITSKPQKAGFPLTFELNSNSLPKKSWVKISQIRVLSVERLGQKITSINSNELDIIIDGLNEIIGD